MSFPENNRKKIIITDYWQQLTKTGKRCPKLITTDMKADDSNWQQLTTIDKNGWLLKTSDNIKKD